MPDISMCDNHKCPSRGKCYRYRAVPDSHYQSYGNFAPETPGKRRCLHFYALMPYHRVQSLEVADGRNES